MLKGPEEWEPGLVQGHASLAAVGVQETGPASAAVKLSQGPEAGDWAVA